MSAKMKYPSIGIGYRCNHLTVIGNAPDKINCRGEKIHRWECKCDCGNTIVTYDYYLRSGRSKSCGCTSATAKYKDISGEKFGKLTALKMIEKAVGKNRKKTQYLCLCECGKYINVTRESLVNGHAQSCGCSKSEKIIENNHKRRKNLLGQVFCCLTVVDYADDYISPSGYKYAQYMCKCVCGNSIIVRSSSLLCGKTKSCGCIKSSGEYTIAGLLSDNNVNYTKQYCFDDLRGIKNGYLRFDFAIFDKENTLQYFIEYDGRQHFIPVELYGGEDGLKERKMNDKLKDKYCQDHHIPLIRIPDIKPTDLTIDDLLLESSTYKVA